MKKPTLTAAAVLMASFTSGASAPDVFRCAAKSPDGVLSFVTEIEDAAFRTGRRDDVEANRWNVQGMIFQIDRFRDRGLLVLKDVPDWLLPSSERGKPGANKGVNAAASYAYAEMLDSAARLYDRSDLAARAAFMRESLKSKGFAPPERNGGSERAALAARVSDELTHEIRPGGVGGQEFWNGNAQMFMYPPSFAFGEVKGAVRYRFQVMDDQQYAHTFEADAPTASLRPVWEFVPRGLVAVFCFGVGGDGQVCGLAGQRRFWKKAPYEPGVYPRAKRPYAEAQKMLCEYILNLPEVAGMERNGCPDLSQKSNFTSYPSKMQSALIRAMLSLARISPDTKCRALKIARIGSREARRQERRLSTLRRHTRATGSSPARTRGCTCSSTRPTPARRSSASTRPRASPSILTRRSASPRRMSVCRARTGRGS